MPRQNDTGPPETSLDGSVTDPDEALAVLREQAAWLARNSLPDRMTAAHAVRLAGVALWLDTHLAHGGVLPTPWARAPELAEGTRATCRHCRGLIRAQGPRPDWAAVNPVTGVPALYCPANPPGAGALALHEPEVAR